MPRTPAQQQEYNKQRREETTARKMEEEQKEEKRITKNLKQNSINAAKRAAASNQVAPVAASFPATSNSNPPPVPSNASASVDAFALALASSLTKGGDNHISINVIANQTTTVQGDLVHGDKEVAQHKSDGGDRDVTIEVLKEVKGLKEQVGKVQLSQQTLLLRTPAPASRTHFAPASPPPVEETLGKNTGFSSPVVQELFRDSTNTLDENLNNSGDYLPSSEALVHDNKKLIARTVAYACSADNSVPATEACNGNAASAEPFAIGDEISGGDVNGQSIQPRLVDFNWKTVQTIGEKQHDLASIKNGIHMEGREVEEWDFGHMTCVLDKELEDQDTCGFLLGGPPLPFGNSGQHHVPTLVLLVLPLGNLPPPFVAQQNFQEGYEHIFPIAQVGLDWKATPSLHERISVLEMNRRLTRGSAPKFEYMTLWTMKPSTDWKRKRDGTLDVRQAQFQYEVRGEVIDEEYDKDEDFCSSADFCDRYDLDPDVHAVKVKEAVKSGFNAEREHIESRIQLLTTLGYAEEVLDNIRVVKIVPQNPFLESSKSTRAYKFYNQYYLYVDELY